MQKLHLVGFTTDHRALILSVRRGARTGGYVLELDDAVTASVADALARRAAALEAEPAPEPGPVPQPAERPESALTVRELQSRLRAGRTVEDVAAEAGVEPEWVARFAPPVVAEQGRVIGATKAARLERSRLGASGLPLGAAVYRNLVERGVRTTADELDRGWSARQGADGRWLVTLTYTSRGRRQQPTWELEGPRGPIRADDRLAAELAFVAPDPAPSAPKPGKPPKVRVSEPTEGDRETARRVSVARKVAEAQLEEAVSASTRRDAEVARRAATTKKAAPPAAPSPAARSKGPAKPEASAPATRTEKPAAKTAAKSASARKASTAKAATAKAATAKAPAKKVPVKSPPRKAPAAKATAGKAAAKRTTPRKTSTENAAATRAAAAKAPAAKASPATAAVTKGPAKYAPPAKASAANAAATKTAPAARHQAPAAPRPTAPATAGAAARPDATDVAAEVARARAEAEAELDAFVARQAASASSALATRAGTPVFRSDLAVPAGRNGDTGTQDAPAGSAATSPLRPRRRTEPLRAR